MKLPYEVVIDASAFLKVIHQEEEDYDKIKRLITLKNQYQLIILVPELFKYEFIFSCARTKGSKLAKLLYDRVMQRQVISCILDGKIIDETLILMGKYPHITFYDAAYHAVAKVNNTIFITADKKYYNHVKAEKDIFLLSSLKINLK